MRSQKPSRFAEIMSSFWTWLKPILKKIWQELRYLNYRFQILRILLLTFLIVFFCLSAFYTFKAKTADVEQLKANLQTTTTIYDHSNEKAGSLYSQKGTYVNIDHISKNVQDAVISTEDRSFYTNPGFSFKGILRAGVSLLLNHGQIMGGGSTITQQLAKNALLSQKQTFSRKGEEVFLAVEITRVYSKKDILAMYLNNAYFGNGVWGVQDAAERYFGKNASDLNVSESATLAAMLRSPSYYNPIDHMDHAVSRRNLVLNLMVQNGKLTQQQAKNAQAESLVLDNEYQQSDGYKYPYYFDAVIDEAVNKYGISEEDIMNKGYKIYTSLNQGYQSKMQNTFDKSYLFPTAATDGTQAQGSSIALDPQTGGVAAVVGGNGEHVFRGWNRATQMKRHPGSTMKPLAVYTPALENGYSYDSELTDEKIAYGSTKYTPTNVDGQYDGKVPMYSAIADSKNAPAVWLLNQIGIQKGVNSVEKFGIEVPKKKQELGLALGDINVSPYQMARAYTAFANQGKMPETHFITKIVDATGAVVVDNTKVKQKTVLSEKNSKEMTSMLLDVFNEGTGTTAKPAGYSVAGKTGSTEVPSEYGYGTRDQWIVGYTPDIVVATWVGFDSTNKNHYMQGISTTGVAKVFKDEMTGILPETAQTKFNTKDASTLAEEKNEKTNPSNWVNDFSNNAKNKVDSAREKANEWYNNVKGFLGIN